VQKFIISLWAVLTDGPKAGHFPVQRRAKERFGEDGKIKPQSFPGVLQPLVAGKGEEGETRFQTLMREAEEEAGRRFVRVLREKIRNRGKDFYLFFENDHPDKKGNLIRNYNYLVRISEKELKKVRLHVGAEPGLIFLSKEDLKDVKTVEEMEKIRRENLVMLPDHLSALKEIFWEIR
jgi:hypothetical protein